MSHADRLNLDITSDAVRGALRALSSGCRRPATSPTPRWTSKPTSATSAAPSAPETCQGAISPAFGSLASPIAGSAWI